MQSYGYQSSYFHTMLVGEKSKNCCLGKNQSSETFCLKSIRCQNQYQLQNICWHFKATKTHLNKIFRIWICFYLKRQGYRYYQKKSSWAYFIIIHKSDNETVDKVIFISCKTGKKWNFTLFWEAVSHFCFKQTLHLFRLHSVL